MKILVAIVLTDEQIKKIGWEGYGNYADELTDQVDCKDWIDNHLADTLDELSAPPE